VTSPIAIPPIIACVTIAPVPGSRYAAAGCALVKQTIVATATMALMFFIFTPSVPDPNCYRMVTIDAIAN
jgi:hypothetical protein